MHQVAQCPKSPEANGQILRKLFKMRGKQEIWHKDAFRGGEFELIRSHPKIDVRTISGAIFVLCFYVLPVKIKI